MPFDTWSVQILTVLAVIRTPGLSQVLMLANSDTHWLRGKCRWG